VKRWLDDGVAALGDALRAISRYPATAAASVGLIAFGAAFVILAAVLTWRVVFHPKDAAPYADQMLVAKAHDPERGLELIDTFGRRFAYIARRQTTLACWVACRLGSTTVKDANGDRHGASSVRIGRGFRECWGLTLEQGRDFRAADHAKGAEKVAILGEHIWRGVFGADPSVVGDTVEIGRETVRVVGISTSLGKPDFGPVDVWLPATDDEIEFGDAYHPLQVEADGRAREGVSFEVVDRELAELDADYLRDNPDNIDAGMRGTLHRYADLRVPPEQRGILWASFIPFVGVFLLACANASGLLLVQFAGRARATALRMALGAPRRTLVLRFVLEGLCLALAGGVLSLVALRFLLAVLPELAPQLSGMIGQGLGGESWDESAVVVAPVVVLVGALLIALFPGLTATRLSVHEVMQDGARSVSGGRRVGRVRDAIANILVGLSYLLVVTSISLGTGLSAAFDQPLGYEPHGLVTASVRFPACERRQQEARAAVGTRGDQDEPDPEHCAPQRRFTAALAALPFVERLAIGMAAPVYMGFHALSLYAVGEERALPYNRRPLAAWYEVEDGYFEVLGTRLVAGRFIDTGDVGFDDCAANFSESLAAMYGGPNGVLGKTLYTGDGGNRRCTVVGVVADMNMGAVPVASPAMIKATYISRRVSEPGERETYLVRAHGDAEEAASAMREWADDAGGGQWELLDVRAVERSVADTRDESMGLVRLFGIVSLVALLFAGLGIYGIVAYSVAARRGEHALRMVLGASRRRVVFEVIARQVRAIWPGLALGIVASVVATPTMANILELPMAFDLLTGLLALVVIVGAVVFAALLPALRAGSIDPWAALREE
jgi:putative ABC transport system permease protein